MEIVQGKATDKKIVIAQEIAFAKVLAGNNKTLRDRAVKKLRKWLTVRGNGRWAFTEEEFLRIWTGLFYCMWMSDKFLVQEELAESISSLIHCFKKNSENALLFIKCFNKRILMDWEGLDQYRIDKFNMLVRRFLRQTFVYVKEKDWDESLLRKLMGMFYNVVLHRDNSLGFVLHFISIYAEELAKVSKGKISKSKVLILIEPFVKLLARSKDMRIQKETEDFFIYLMKQTDTGIEFEEKFNAWREQGFPGDGPHCMGSVNITDENEQNEENGVNEDEDEDDDYISQDEPLDPRAGSVHVYLPQVPIDINGFISLFERYKNSRLSNNKGRKILKSLMQKYGALNKGRFPAKIKKDPILNENLRKKKLSVKNAKKLIEFTQKINEGPIKTKEFRKLNKELELQEDSNSECDSNNEEFEQSDMEGEYEVEEEEEDEAEEEEEEEEEAEMEVEETKQPVKKNNAVLSKKQKSIKNNIIINNKSNSNSSSNNNNNNNNNNSNIKKKEKVTKKREQISNDSMQEVKENRNLKENGELRKKKKKKKKKGKNKKLEDETTAEEVVVKTKKNHKVNGVINGIQEEKKQFQNVNNVNKTGRKRKILSNWQVQELDSSSPEYYDIKTQKIIRLEKKTRVSCCEENGVEEEEEAEEVVEEKETTKGKTSAREIVPEFWVKATQKVNKKVGSKNKVFLNPFAKLENESKSPGRRISFALDKNMAQENEQYLEEVKNSPRVPFDGTKKPVQSALKSGLAPSPVNPFYRFKKIKF